MIKAARKYPKTAGATASICINAHGLRLKAEIYDAAPLSPHRHLLLAAGLLQDYS
jgi:hypothetical protein